MPDVVRFNSKAERPRVEKPRAARLRQRTCLAALVFFCLFAASAAQAQTPSAAKPEVARSGPDSKSLVVQLGNEQFSIRESATNQLIQRGTEARPILVAAMNSNDAEVKFRARRILSKIVESDFLRRLAAFEADIDGTANTSLPGWEVYKETIGSTPEARKLFVDMQRAETVLFDAYEQGPEQALEALKERSQKAWNTVQPMRRRGNQSAGAVSLANAAALLFVGSDPKLKLSDEIATRLTALPKSDAFKNALSGGDKDKQLYRNLAGRWVAREMSLQLLSDNLNFAANYNLKEALVPAIKTLKSTDATTRENSRLRTNAMLLIAKLGSKEHVQYLEPYFKDSQLCLEPPLQVEMRDLALWVVLKLRGSNPAAFGFDRVQPNENNGLNLSSIAFRNDDERQAAFKKWEDSKLAQK